MSKIKRAKPSPALLVSVVALVAALGGGAVAGVTVTKLSDKEKQEVRRISKKQAEKVVDAMGARPQGWAVVDADGTLAGGSAGVSSTQLFTPGTDGSYEVDFGIDLRDCALLATLGRVDAKPFNPDPGEIGTAYRNGNPNAVYVKTTDGIGADANRSFHLAVFC